MDSLQQRIIEIAQQIPEYVGYAAKERRRDIDRHLRRQLAAKYDQQRTRLSRLQQRAGLDYVVKIEQLDQKLLRLIAQFNTAPRGYAGWFDAAQIGDDDLDQLTRFDADLADGVTRLKTKLDALADTFKSMQAIDDAIDACADMLDTLNAEFDQRDEFVAQGKKPTLDFPKLATASPLGALQAKKSASPEFTALANLKVNDAITCDVTDYIVAGKITFDAKFWAYLLQDGGKKRWLRVGPGEQIALCDEIALRVSTPLPDSLEYAKQSFTRDVAGNAKVSVEGAGGIKRGNVEYARYAGEAGSILWIEDFGTETRAMQGQTLDPSELKLYRR